MILFFLTPEKNVIATQFTSQPDEKTTQALCWLYGEASLLPDTALSGCFVGPRREMVTPWSTNAVEITQNMGLSGIVRIEEYFPVASPQAPHDEMLQRLDNGLDQEIFTVNIQPAEICFIDDLAAYNEQEGLALSPEEIDYLHGVESQLGRRLTDSEVFGFAQINSEHCRHKIFGGTFIIDGEEKPSSLFAMIKKTTQLHPGRIISAYKDNVAFAEGPVVEQFAPKDHATSDFFVIRDIESVISLKAETHNFPTTVEPFNGASTGTGGEIRDRMGGGTGSWPIAGTAVYMTSYPRLTAEPMPWEQVLPVRQWLYQTPEQILVKASNGASDFGNKFGQPLITGSVLTFEHQERGEKYGYDKVVMLAGGVGYGTRRDCLKGTPRKGNKVVVVGGDNYRIGLGGGSVSSVDTGRYSTGLELNAVQRANPEMQKRANNLIRALCEEDVNPVVSIHDHGSAGHVNCLSELVEECGGLIDMSALPIGDPTLSAKEIIANESQERMGLLIDEEHIAHVEEIARRERAPLYVVGETTGDAHFAFQQADGRRPFDLDVAQMFGHSPRTVMRDVTVPRHYEPVHDDEVPPFEEALQKVLRLEAVACKDWLTNKVDRSVTGKVALQQCQGVHQLPLADCGIVALDYRGRAGIATALGHAPAAALASPEAGSRLSVAEALTNLVWAPLRLGLDGVSLSANWMWPCRSQKGEDARLYAAVEALSEFCIALGVNVPTGKDSLSLSQQYPNGEKIISPGTVIVSAGGEVDDVRKAVRPVLQPVPSRLLYVDFSRHDLALGGSALAQSLGKVGSDVPDVADAAYFRSCFTAVQTLVHEGLLLAGHDISAGGLTVALLEMCFAADGIGLDADFSKVCRKRFGFTRTAFAENPGVVIQVANADLDRVNAILAEAGVESIDFGAPCFDAAAVRIQTCKREYVLDVDQYRRHWAKTSALLDEKQTAGGQAAVRFENLGRQPIRYDLGDFDGTFRALGPEVNPDRRTPSGVRAAIIREKGTNGEREMAYVLYLAGFDVKDVTMTDLVAGRETLEDVQMIVFCGGFSNSDVLGSAKGWAGAFLYNDRARRALDAFYARPDTLSLGVCNGCQLMMELGLLGYTPEARMHHNVSHKFESAFVGVEVPENHSVMFGALAGKRLGIWVAHGEGRFSLPGAAADYHQVLRYQYDTYPACPNGSDFATAGIASADGRHLAMMPHLERAFFPWQCGFYPTSRLSDECTPWLQAFVEARRWCETHK